VSVYRLSGGGCWAKYGIRLNVRKIVSYVVKLMPTAIGPCAPGECAATARARTPLQDSSTAPYTNHQRCPPCAQCAPSNAARTSDHHSTDVRARGWFVICPNWWRAHTYASAPSTHNVQWVAACLAEEAAADAHRQTQWSGHLLVGRVGLVRPICSNCEKCCRQPTIVSYFKRFKHEEASA
jgi:hypothetical protein